MKGSDQSLTTNQEPDPEDQGDDGVPRQEHRDESLQEVQVPD